MSRKSYCPDDIHEPRVAMEEKERLELGKDVVLYRFECPSCGANWLMLVNAQQ